MKKLLLLISLFQVFLFSECSDNSDVEPLSIASENPVPITTSGERNTSVNYIIPAGSHDANQSSFQLLTKKTHMKFNARFNSSAIYHTVEKNNQGDINKLYGMSDCSGTHQINSARFGWRWFNDALEIWAYTYANGVRKFAFVSTVPLDSMRPYEIIFTDTEYIFHVDNSTVSLPRHCSDDASGYKLYPYFGGDEAAPHEITIEIEDLE